MSRYRNMIEVSLVVLIIFVGMYNLRLSSELKQLKQEVNEVHYLMDDVSKQVDHLVEMNQFIYDSKYDMDLITQDNVSLGDISVVFKSNKLGDYENIKILYRETYDMNKTKNHDYASSEWRTAEVNNNKGTYSSKIIVPLSCNYEVKIAYQGEKGINYEQLPDLDLYSKAENMFMKGITIYDVNQNDLEFDVQIAKYKTSYDVELMNAICNVYHGNEIVNTFDILQENEIEGRKEPRNQLEHDGEDYWFIIKKIDISKIEELDVSDISIEVVLHDSIKNHYRMIRKIND